MFLGYLESSRGLFDGLGWYLDDLEWSGQNSKKKKILLCFQQFSATPPITNDTIKRHDEKRRKKRI